MGSNPIGQLMSKETYYSYIDHYTVECVLHHGEFSLCNVTLQKCPEQTEDKDGYDTGKIPDDCPAKCGVCVKLRG